MVAELTLKVYDQLTNFDCFHVEVHQLFPSHSTTTEASKSLAVKRLSFLIYNKHLCRTYLNLNCSTHFNTRFNSSMSEQLKIRKIGNVNLMRENAKRGEFLKAGLNSLISRERIFKNSVKEFISFIIDSTPSNFTNTFH